MTTFLLIIIAIGVLLSSEAGQEFLDGLSMLALIGGGLFISFWIVVIAIGLFSNYWDTISIGIAVIVWSVCIIYLFNQAHKKLKTKEKRAETWKDLKNGTKEAFREAFSKKKIVGGIYFFFIIFMVAITVFFLMAIPLGGGYYSGMGFNIALACFVVVWIIWIYALIKRNRIKKHNQKEL